MEYLGKEKCKLKGLYNKFKSLKQSPYAPMLELNCKCDCSLFRKIDKDNPKLKFSNEGHKLTVNLIDFFAKLSVISAVLLVVSLIADIYHSVRYKRF